MEVKDSIEEHVIEHKALIFLIMKNDIILGANGFTDGFFKFMFSDLKYIVIRAINNLIEIGESSPTNKLEIITCILKHDKSIQLFFLKIGVL